MILIKSVIKLLIFLFTGFFLICCNSESSKLSDRIENLEKENAELRLKKENIELQEKIKNKVNEKIDQQYNQLVSRFEFDRDKEIQQRQQNIDKNTAGIEKIKNSCKCDFDIEPSSVKNVQIFMSLTSLKSEIYFDSSGIERCNSKEYREKWMMDHGYIE